MAVIPHRCDGRRAGSSRWLVRMSCCGGGTRRSDQLGGHFGGHDVALSGCL